LTLRPGESFGRYVVDELLGFGGMGEVYRARDSTLNRTVALKILRVAPDGDALSLGAAGQILAEARAAAVVDHPNAVAVFDVGEAAGVPFLAMEYIPGKSLRAHLTARDTTISTRIAWLVSVAEALAAAHRKRVIHQDIKPENVMVSDEGVLKVLDFGIARRLPPDGEVATRTMRVGGDTMRVGADTTPSRASRPAVVGTLRYMAPEQLRRELVDGRTDQFSWAVMAYEALTGVHPWTSQTEGTLPIISMIFSKAPDPPSAVAPDVPPHLDAVILRALAKAKDDRFPTMLDLIAAVRGAGAPSTGDAAASTISRAPPPPRGREGSRLRRGAIAGVALAAALGAVAWRARRPAEVAGVAQPADAGAAPVGPPDFGSRMSANAEALAAYKAGIQAMRDAASASARQNFERATELDPGFAAAHLRKILASGIADDGVRGHALKATTLRADLGPHDRALLQAIEPWTRIPQETSLSVRLFVDAAAAQPDSDTRLQLCRLRIYAGDYREAVDACRAARENDPRLTASFWLEGVASLFLGENADGARSLAECIRLSPGATGCLRELLYLREHDGQCVEALALARQLNALDPEQAEWFDHITFGLVATGAPDESARLAAETELAREAKADVPITRERVAVKFLLRAGDFAGARRELDAFTRTAERGTDEGDVYEAFVLKDALERETGHSAAAAASARSYMARSAAYATAPAHQIAPLVALYRLGALPREDFVRQRDAWLAQQKTRTVRAGAFDDVPGAWWIEAYAKAAVTEEDAVEAIDALPAYAPIPPDRFREPSQDLAIGAAYARARRPVDAAAYLRRAAGSCRGFVFPFEHVQARLALGGALLAAGERDAACASFAEVTRQWPGRSLTADAARASMRRASCR